MSLRSPRFVSWLLTVTCVSGSGCGDPQTTSPEPDLVSGPANVSEPMTLAPHPAGRTFSLVAPQVYVSIPAQTFIGGIAALIRNTRTGSSVTGGMISGGLDPVILEAAVGDTLEFTITFAGRSSVQFVSRVPQRKPPVVVRTDPPPQRRDVPLNSILIVVFSEPIDSVTVSGGLTLTNNGVLVSATVALSGDGLRATVVPNAPLIPSTSYVLNVKSSVSDLDGDFLEAPVSVSFTTAALPSEPPALPSDILAFTEADGGLSLISVDGAYYARLTGGGGPYFLDLEAAWSPDGSRIAFVRHHNLATEIYLIDVDGTNLLRISPAGAYDAHPTWSSDGSRIAFASRPDTLSDSDVYLMNADGTNRQRLTTHPQPEEFPTWSPDGATIAFVSYNGTPDGIHLMNPDGTNRRTFSIDGLTGNGPAWSPDSKRLVFAREGSLYLSDADGTNMNPMANTLYGTEPSWSPDGLTIAFSLQGPCQWTPPEWCPLPLLSMVRVADGVLIPLAAINPVGMYPSWRPMPSAGGSRPIDD